jgi:hypothetical protein
MPDEDGQDEPRETDRLWRRIDPRLWHEVRKRSREHGD